MTTETPVTIGVLALQGDVADHVRIIESTGAQAITVRRESELESVDGLVLPGGESTTMIKLLRIFDLAEPLRRRLAEGMPVYGSCAGMILLAEKVLDGVPGQETVGGLDITVRRNAFGRQVASFEADIEVSGVTGEPVRAVFIRAPWVEECGSGVEILARVDLPEGGEAVVAVRQGDLLATSFHPEMTNDPRLHALFVRMVRERAVRMPGKSWAERQAAIEATTGKQET